MNPNKTDFPVGGPRLPVYHYLQRLGFTMSAWSDKAWRRADGKRAQLFGAGSMVSIDGNDMPLADLADYLRRAET